MPRDNTVLRNIGIAAHIDAGKTTCSERILYYTGQVHKMGEVHDGTTVTDFDEEERQRGITIYSAAISAPWLYEQPAEWLYGDDTAAKTSEQEDNKQGITRKGVMHQINVIDTPGHVDFTAEVERSLRVLDGAIAVFDGKEGVEAQSETVWRQATKYSVPRICFINKMDKMGADFEFSFNSIRERLGAPAVAVQYPIGQGNEFQGSIDLVKGVEYHYSGEDQGTTVTEKPISDENKPTYEAWREKLVEACADVDDAIAEKFLEGEDVSMEEIKAALRKGTIEFKLHPVFCGSALKYVGVQKLIDGVIEYLPSPLDLPPVKAIDAKDQETIVERHCDPDEPFCGLAFKIVADKFGELTFVRVYSGTVGKGTRILNVNRDKKENLSRIFQMQADDRIALDQGEAGDIIACVGLKDVLTGDTITDVDNPVLLERPTFPEPVISMSIEPKSAADKQKLGDALVQMRRVDPTFFANYDEETGETIIAGMGELHLEIIRNRLTREQKVDVIVGKPKVAYKETITGSAEARGLFKKQTGGSGMFGDATITVEPYTQEDFDAEENPKFKFVDGMAFENKVVGGAIPREFIPSVEKGARDAMKTGVLANFPMLNVKVTLIDGSSHAVDSKPPAYEQAGSLAFRDASTKAGLVLLEPIMKVTITTPDEFFGNVTGDLNKRRGLILDQRTSGNTRVIEAEVPLAEMFGYTTELRSMSQGRAQSAMEPLKYSPVPNNVQKAVLEEVG
ncbi:MAG: elongation factor G [Planctomycetota bacterium]